MSLLRQRGETEQSISLGALDVWITQSSLLFLNMS